MSDSSGLPQGGWAAAGQSIPNANTLNLRYEGVELGFDESVSLRCLVRMALNAIVVSFLAWILIFLGSLSSSSPSNSYSGEYGDSGPSDPLTRYFSSATTATGWSFVVLFVALMIQRLDEPISEWKALVEDKANAATSAYAAIQGSLGRRQIPVQAVPARVRSDIGREVVANRLVISRKPYVVYVTVFPFGTSLYLGWTMWRRRSGFSYLGTLLKDVVGGLLGVTGTVKQMLRTEGARAMREAVHSAAREGAETAIKGVEVPIASTFGVELPIVDIENAQLSGQPVARAKPPHPAPASPMAPPPPTSDPEDPGPTRPPVPPAR
ncbi:hypothetical protein [Streptomyces asiaticus]